MHHEPSPFTLVAESHLRAADTASTGPGWFDSSWELRQGLVVTEADADADLWSALYRPAGRLISLRTARPRSITAIA